MTTRQRIIEKINKIQDVEVLEQIGRWLDAFSETEEIFMRKEVAAVQEGYEQNQAGNVISEEESRKQFSEWISEK